MTASDFIIDTQEKMLVVMKGLYELTVSNQALLSALRERLPDVDYERHHRAAARSESSKALYDSIRSLDESLALIREKLTGK